MIHEKTPENLIKQVVAMHKRGMSQAEISKACGIGVGKLRAMTADHKARLAEQKRAEEAAHFANAPKNVREAFTLLTLLGYDVKPPLKKD